MSDEGKRSLSDSFVPAYFVMLSKSVYRVYGTKHHNYYTKYDHDPACIWRGDSLSEARRKCKEANEFVKRKQSGQEVEVLQESLL